MKTILFVTMAASVAFSQSADSDWRAHNDAGMALVNQLRFADAEQEFRGALAVAQQFPENDLRLSTSISRLAMVREQRGDFPGAEKLYRQVLELRERTLAAGDPLIADALVRLAAELQSCARYKEADPLLRRAVALDEAAHDDARTADALNGLGLTLAGRGETARAEPVLRRSRELLVKTKGEDSFEVARVSNSIATNEALLREFGKAETELRRALPVFERVLGPESPTLAAVLNNAFAVISAQNRFADAEPFLDRAVKIMDKTPVTSPQMLCVRSNQASFEAEAGNLSQSARIFEQVIPVEERMLGSNHPQVARTLQVYSKVLREMHRKAEARQAQMRASAILKSFHQKKT